MQVTVQRTGVEDEVLLSGRLDGRSAGEVRDTLHAVLGAGSGRLVVDLSGIELLDATGLGVLVGAHRRARLTGRDLVLRGAPSRVARLLRLARLDRVITVEPPARPERVTLGPPPRPERVILGPPPRPERVTLGPPPRLDRVVAESPAHLARA